MMSRQSGVALLYHDVVPRDRAAESGIVTDGSWRYKLTPEVFRKHLEVIDDSSYRVTPEPADGSEQPLVLTFDDGGVSCSETVAPLLGEFGFRGLFFIITGRIGDCGYVTHDQVRDLAQAGHRVGSHTVTHMNLRELDSSHRRQELLESKETLEDLLGSPCESISIPGGFTDSSVIADALDVGYETVFVSEPRYLKSRNQAIGRWNMWHDTTPADLEGILERSLGTRVSIQGRWYTLKTIKRLIGQDRFERLRRPFISKD